MAAQAFRHGDITACPEHGVGVADQVAGTVRVNGRALLRVGSSVKCGGEADRVGTGAVKVTVGSMYSARVGEHTAHGATLAQGSVNVLIGSPSGAGAPLLLSLACLDMISGRNPPPGSRSSDGTPLPSKSESQSYNNCGLEACRTLILQATKREVDQEALFDYAIDHYLSPEKRKERGLPPYESAQSKAPAKRYESGGTDGDEQVAILKDFGVPSHVFDQTPESIYEGLAQGKGVLVGVYAGTLWMDERKDEQPTGPHAILITGVERDENGKVTAYIINDSAYFGCGATVPADRVHRALLAKGVMTDKPIW